MRAQRVRGDGLPYELPGVGQLGHVAVDVEQERPRVRLDPPRLPVANVHEEARVVLDLGIQALAAVRAGPWEPPGACRA